MYFCYNTEKATNTTSNHSPAMLILKRAIRIRIDLLLFQLKSQIQEKIRKGGLEFGERKSDNDDTVAVSDYRSANLKWKFGRIINKDGALHYTINVQGALVRRYIDQIHSVGEQENDYMSNGYRRFRTTRFKETPFESEHPNAESIIPQ